MGSPTVNHGTWRPLSCELRYGHFWNTSFYDQSALPAHLSLLFHVVFQSVINNHIGLTPEQLVSYFFIPFYTVNAQSLKSKVLRYLHFHSNTNKHTTSISRVLGRCFVFWRSTYQHWKAPMIFSSKCKASSILNRIFTECSLNFQKKLKFVFPPIQQLLPWRQI